MFTKFFLSPAVKIAANTAATVSSALIAQGTYTLVSSASEFTEKKYAELSGDRLSAHSPPSVPHQTLENFEEPEEHNRFQKF